MNDGNEARELETDLKKASQFWSLNETKAARYVYNVIDPKSLLG